MPASSAPGVLQPLWRLLPGQPGHDQQREETQMAVANQTKTIVGVFNDLNDAQEAVRDLEMEGISRSDISVVANKNTASGFDTEGSTAQGTLSTTRSTTGTDPGFNNATDNREM